MTEGDDIMIRTLVLLALATIATTGITCRAWAVNLRTGQSIIFDRDETVTEDILAAGNRIEVMSAVRGDVTAAGRSVSVSGSVTDSVLLAGENVSATGRIGNDAWMAGSRVILGGPVSDNAYLAGSTVELSSAARVESDLLAAGNQVNVLGDVGGSARIAGNNVVIGGTINEDVYVRANRLRLLDGAVIRGDLHYTSANEAQIAPGAGVRGETVRSLPERERARPMFWSGALWWIWSLIAAIIFGIVLLLLFPDRSREAAVTVRGSLGLSLGIGFLALIAVPVAIVIAFITVIGIPLGLAALAVYLVLLYVANIIAALALGGWIVARVSSGRATPHRIWSMILGLVVLSIIGLIPILGGLILLLALLAGLGGLLLSWWRERQAQQPVA